MLTIQEIVLVFGLIGVLGGWALGRVGSWWMPTGGSRAEGLNHRIRALEAELRVTQRKAEEAELAVERSREETDALRKQMEAAVAEFAEKDTRLQELERQFTAECAKTQRLRHELTDRAAEAIKASVRVKEAETELSVARAGSDAVLDQVQRLVAEREELTGRLQVLQAENAGRGKVSRLPVREPKDRPS